MPLSYAGGEVPETNIGLMPALVPCYEVGAQWKTAEVGKLLDQDRSTTRASSSSAGSGRPAASPAAPQPLVAPDDAKGMKVRGGSREMDMMLKEAGASVISLPSNEIYAAMQTGAMDAAMTSSTSLISFRLEEIAKHLTTGRNKAYWFMFEPLMMSKEVFDKLPKAQQDIDHGGRRRAWRSSRSTAAKADDKAVADVYAKAGAKVYDLDEPTRAASGRRSPATPRGRTTRERNETCAALLKAAQKLL